MELSLIDEGGVRAIEGVPDQLLIRRLDDANRVLEACFSGGAGGALLYGKNLTNEFFDLSSGEAAAILQKFRNYGVRLAVVCPPGSVRFSTRFAEMVTEERLRRYFGVFDTREAALEWLAPRGQP